MVSRALSAMGAFATHVIVATKGGCTRVGGGWERDVTAAHLRTSIRDSHRALGAQRPIALWQVHWVRKWEDGVLGARPEGETMAQLLAPVAEACAAGLIKHVGLSNATVEDLEEALAFLPPGTLASVQNKYQPAACLALDRLNFGSRLSAEAAIVRCRYNMFEQFESERPVLQWCVEHGIAYLPYGVLGGSKRRGKYGEEAQQKEAASLQSCENLGRIAQRKGVSAESLLLAWMLARWSCLVHIVGARTLKNLADSLSASRISLSRREIAAIESDGGAAS